MSENDPRIIDSAESIPDWDAQGSDVRKIVVGQAPVASGSDAKPLSVEAMPADFAQRFPRLTHLYLWQIEGLKALPELPEALECLDVRGCSDLSELPALPPQLETLDLGGCTRLTRLPGTTPARLRRFFFDGCPALKPHSLAGFLEQALYLEELDGSAAPGLTSLEQIPKERLRKLVLKGCEKLTDVRGLASFPVLEHLNLSGCIGLQVLPELPPRLRFLLLHGAESLGVFMAQDIGPYDRGAEGENVCKAFRSREKFGHELSIMPHAKLLLMGDGRVGKTTLAKRLQWEELDTEARGRAENADMRPSREEQFTHKVRFWRWQTGLELPEKDKAALEARAKAAGVELPKTLGGSLDGAVRLWDFGGQEIYHATHRIFAGEGSIFLVVWRAEKPAIGAQPADVTPEEWEEWNRARPVDYWLDYIYSLRPDAQVALVCTNCRDPDNLRAKPDWKTSAPKNRQRDLPAFFVDSLDDRSAQHSEYQRLVAWIREACGREALRIGILQPRFFREVSDLVDGWLAGNSQSREKDADAEHLLLPWEKWEESVRAVHSRHSGARPALALDSDDVTAVTNYLHEAGHLFQIRHAEQRAVLVDQEWATELIYRLLLAGGPLRRTAKRNGGWFYAADLEADPVWKALGDDLQRTRLRAYMEECRVVTRIADAKQHSLGRDVFLASDKWLLPPFEDVKKHVDEQVALLKSLGNMAEREQFEFESVALSEMDFRSLQALLARTFGTRAVYFREGFQALDPDAQPEWCFRVKWQPSSEEDPCSGKIDATLLARRGLLEKVAREIEDLFYGEGSPIAGRRRVEPRRLPVEEHDLGHAYFSLRQGEHDVAVSSSGGDAAEAEALVGALKASGLKVSWYRLPECRIDERDRVLPFMHSLGRSPCTVLLVSAAYLSSDPVVNWYCAWELADAIVRLGEGKRTAAQTLVVFKEGGGFVFAKFDSVVSRLLAAMSTHFHDLYSPLDRSERRIFQYYDDFTRHFDAASSPEHLGKFIAARGALGAALRFPPPAAPGTSFDFTQIILAVEQATGKKARA